MRLDIGHVVAPMDADQVRTHVGMKRDVSATVERLEFPSLAGPFASGEDVAVKIVGHINDPIS